MTRLARMFTDSPPRLIEVQNAHTAQYVVTNRGLDVINSVRSQLAGHPGREFVGPLEQEFTEAMVPSR